MFTYYTQDDSATIPTLVSHQAEGCPMPDAYLGGRPVYFGDINHGADSVDSFFENAHYCDTDRELDDEELSRLSEENQEHLDAEWFEHQIGRADWTRDE